jgi:heme oxygenase
MNNLRQLTLDNHKRAERSNFIRRLLKREMTPYQYYVYLSNQLLCYYTLEAAATSRGLFDGLESIKRSTKISKDLSELEREYGFETVIHLKSVKKYMDHIGMISTDQDRLMAHIYVRHMGDLSGGQMIKKLVPGSGLHYQFDEDVDVLKDKIREKLHDGMATEANICFDMIHDFFEELEGTFNDVGFADKSPKAT